MAVCVEIGVQIVERPECSCHIEAEPSVRCSFVCTLAELQGAFSTAFSNAFDIGQED